MLYGGEAGMKKIWSFLWIIVVVLLVLGIVCAGVGFLTGADFGRIFEIVDKEYDVVKTAGAYYDSFQTFVQSFFHSF